MPIATEFAVNSSRSDASSRASRGHTAHVLRAAAGPGVLARIQVRFPFFYYQATAKKLTIGQLTGS